MNDKKQIYQIRYTLSKDQIQDFLDQLEAMQHDYLEAAVEASNYRDAKMVIDHVRNLK